jgi:hypothetical protein
MRTVAEYLEKAAEFDELARSTSDLALKKRFSDIAECYRLLARERERLMAAGAIEMGRPLNRLSVPGAKWH